MWQLSYQRALKKNIKIGEFLCNHFIIEDGRKKETFSEHIMLYYFKKGKNTTKTKKKFFCAVYGEGAVIDWTCQKWFAKFRAGDFSLDDTPWLDRPVEVDSNQIETLRMINVIPHGR